MLPRGRGIALTQGDVGAADVVVDGDHVVEAGPPAGVTHPVEVPQLLGTA